MRSEAAPASFYDKFTPRFLWPKANSQQFPASEVMVLRIGAHWVLLSFLGFQCEAAPADWMGENFEVLRDRSLLGITLPGSHNSGNYQGALHADLLPVRARVASSRPWVCLEKDFAFATTLAVTSIHRYISQLC